MGQISVLVVDDEAAIRRNFRISLEDLGYRVEEACGGRQALDLLSRDSFDIVLTDLRMDGMGGLELVEVLASRLPALPTIVVSGTGNTRDAVEAIRHGAWDFVMKPVLDTTELEVVICRTLEKARLMVENRGYQEHLEELVEERTHELAVSEQRYRRITEAITDCIYTIRIESGAPVPSRHAPGCVGVTGYSEEEFASVPDLWTEVVPPDDRDAVMQMKRHVVEKGPAAAIEHRIVRKDGTVRWVRHTLLPRYDGTGVLKEYDGLLQDVTERKRAEEEKAEMEEMFRQAQKMESIGRLAGGVAHDFNNILMTISGFAELAMESLHEADPVQAQLHQVTKAATRGAAITRQLLAFSRNQIIEPTHLDINEIISSIATMLGRLMREDVHLILRLSKPVGMVLADRGQIEQVLINLCVNARDAMPDGGQIRIETAVVALDETFAGSHPEIRPGEHVLLTVQDAGCGMTADVKSHLFEPFFTTKPVGQGTGLGMSIVYGAVTQNGGAIDVESEIGAGTTFRIYLPVAHEAKRTQPKAPVAGTMPRGSETVLAVEDDDALRDYTGLVLRRLGYRVISCANGGEALVAAHEHVGPIHLLLTDVIMPKMNGRVLSEKLALARPDTKCLFVSGYASEIISHQGVLGTDAAFLGKPYDAMKLACKIRETLDGDASGESGS